VGTLVYAFCDGPIPVREGIDRCESLLGASDVGDEAFTAVVGVCLANLYAMEGRADSAAGLLDRSLAVLDELNQLSITWVYRAVAAEAKWLLGDAQGAEKELRAKRMRFEEVKDFEPDARAMQASYQLAHLLCDGRRWSEAAECLEY